MFLLIEVAALGVQGWSVLKNDAAKETRRIESEFSSIERTFEEKASQFRSVLALGRSVGVGTLAMESRLEGADRVFRVAPTGNRASLADEASRTLANWLVRNNETFAVTDRHLVVTSRDGSETYAATFPLTDTLPALPARDARILATPAVEGMQAPFGASPVLQKLNAPFIDYQSGFDNLWVRHTTVCRPSDIAPIELCQVTTRPWFSILGTGALFSYIILVLAPTLAVISILGMMRRAIRSDDAPKNAKTKTQGRNASQVTGSLSSGWMEGALHKITSQIGTSAWRVDDELKTISFSGQLANILNLEPGSSIALARLEDLFGHDNARRLNAAIRKGASEGRLRGVISLPSAEKTRYIEFRGQAPVESDPDWQGIGLAGQAVDITERRMMEERMRVSEHRLRQALEGFSMPIAIWDDRKRLIFWNASFESTFGLEEGSLRVGMPHDSVNLQIAQGVRLDRQIDTESGERELQLYDGRWFSIAERLTTSGQLIMIGTDISALKTQRDQHVRNEKMLKRAYTELQRSEGRANELMRKYAEEKTKAEHASQAKGSFLANISHELRTPLNAINGFSEMLVKQVFGPLGDERYHSYAQDILVSGQHLLDMINDILDMAKIESGKMTINTKPIDPIEPVDAAIRMIRRKADEKSITLDLVCSDDVREIEADHRAVRQMVLNLTSNAIKFTPENGRVTTRVINQHQGVVIQVEDTGVGIPKDDIPRLANPFEQVESNQDMNPNGTGLGLALTRSLAEMHGGKFSIESELGKGTTVSIYLPAQQPDIPEAAA